MAVRPFDESTPVRTIYSLQDSPQRRRLSLFKATLGHWLNSQGVTASQHDAMIDAWESALAAWLETDGRATQGDILSAFTHFLTRHQAPVPLPATPTLGSLTRAFASCMLVQAGREVENEAHGAGHAAAFTALRPYLERNPEPEQIADLVQMLGLDEATIATALASLRRRYRQRIESALVLCSESIEGRQSLRHRLHVALTQTESTP